MVEHKMVLPVKVVFFLYWFIIYLYIWKRENTLNQVKKHSNTQQLIVIAHQIERHIKTKESKLMTHLLIHYYTGVSFNRRTHSSCFLQFNN